MSVFNSISVPVLIVLLVAGLITGLSVASIDLLNPNTSAAEVNLMNIEAAHKQATYELQERLAAAQTEAEIQEIQRTQAMADAQYKHDIQGLNQDLANRQTAFNICMTVATMFGGALSISIIILSIRMTVPKKVLAVPTEQIRTPERATRTPVKVRILPTREPYDPWNKPEYQKSIIQQACDNEREKQDEDKVNARLQAFCRTTQPAPRVRIISSKQYSCYPRAS